MADLTRFASDVIRGLGRPVTQQGVRNLLGWFQAEGGWTHNNALYNPLNTTQSAPGAGNTGSQGNIKVYRSFGQGVNATVQTLRNGRYGGILSSLDSDPNTFAQSVRSSPWGTKTDFSGLIRGAKVGAINTSGGTSTAADAGGGAAAASSPASQVQLTPESLAAIRQYGAQSEQDVLRGKTPASAVPIGQRLRTQGAPPAARRQVVGDAAQFLGQPSDPSADQAINAAKSVLGTPYSWGGGTPSGPTKGIGRGANTTGFDCSSLVQMAWAKAGVKLPRTTYDQIKVGSAVSSIKAARPGDLLFPHAGHVQMYLGGGKVIEAPQTGGHVQIVPARSKYLAIRRPA